MPFTLCECNDQDQDNLDRIWEEIWLKFDFNKLVDEIENDDLLPILLRYLPKTGKILEGGCGLGRWVIYLRDNGYDIIGIDFAKGAIESIKKFDNSLPVELGNITNTRFLDNYFEAYISLGVVEHFREGPLMALKEAKRILKQNGLLLISIPIFNLARKCTFCLEWVFDFLRENKYVRRLVGKGAYPSKHFFEYRYSIKEFENILLNEKFDIIAKFPWDHGPLSGFNCYNEAPFFIRKNNWAYRQCEKISIFLARRFEWISPNSVIWICKNNKKI